MYHQCCKDAEQRTYNPPSNQIRRLSKLFLILFFSNDRQCLRRLISVTLHITNIPHTCLLEVFYSSLRLLTSIKDPDNYIVVSHDPFLHVYMHILVLHGILPFAHSSSLIVYLISALPRKGSRLPLPEKR